MCSGRHSGMCGILSALSTWFKTVDYCDMEPVLWPTIASPCDLISQDLFEKYVILLTHFDVFISSHYATS